MSKILLYTKELILAECFDLVINNKEGLEVLPYCDNILSLVERIYDDEPDLVLIDLDQEITFEVLRSIKNTRSRIVVWVDSISMEFALQSVSLGVRGILSKKLSIETQIKCFQEVLNEKVWFGDFFENVISNSFSDFIKVKLTPRQGQIVALVSCGLGDKEISKILNISIGTERVYLSRLYKKIGVRKREGLVFFGLKNITNGQSSLNNHFDHPDIFGPSFIFLDRLILDKKYARKNY